MLISYDVDGNTTVLSFLLTGTNIVYKEGNIAFVSKFQGLQCGVAGSIVCGT